MPRSTAEIDADLTAAYAARRKCLDAQSWGGGGSSVTRANLAQINDTITALEQEKTAAETVSAGGGTVQFIPTQRGW